MDILKLIKKLSNFLLIEIIFLGISIVIGTLLYIFLVQSSDGWDSLGALFIFVSVVIGCLVILSIIALVNLIRAIFINCDVNNYLKQNIPIETQLLNKFKNKYHVILIVNILLTLPAILLLLQKVSMSIPTKADQESEQSKQVEYKESVIKGEPDRISRLLLDFKSSAESTQVAFVGYGVTQNTGSCINLVPGSLFDARTGFKPKLIKDPDWKTHSIVNTVNNLGYSYVTQRINFNNPLFNNMSDAKCYSDEDHYAYQLPNYLEDPYPTFYCVDDSHTGVQKSNKQIKSSNCEDFDPNYVPPAIRPEPDMKGY